MTFLSLYTGFLDRLDRFLAWTDSARGWFGFFGGLTVGVTMTGMILVSLIVDMEKAKHGVYGAASSVPYGYATSDTAKAIAAQVAPGLQSAAQGHQKDFVSRVGGPVSRLAANAVYPAIVREIPVGMEIGTDVLLSHFGSFSLTDLAKTLVSHAKAHAEDVHPSLTAAAEPHHVRANPQDLLDRQRPGCVCDSCEADGGGKCATAQCKCSGRP